MRAVVQRVSSGRVTVTGRLVAHIDRGVVILLGIGPQDGEEQARFLVEKIAHLRIFEDEQGKMNRSLLDINGQAIVVSQFTLYADTRQGSPALLHRRRRSGNRPPAGRAFRQPAARAGSSLPGG